MPNRFLNALRNGVSEIECASLITIHQFQSKEGVLSKCTINLKMKKSRTKIFNKVEEELAKPEGVNTGRFDIIISMHQF